MQGCGRCVALAGHLQPAPRLLIAFVHFQSCLNGSLFTPAPRCAQPPTWVILRPEICTPVHLSMKTPLSALTVATSRAQQSYTSLNSRAL